MSETAPTDTTVKPAPPVDPTLAEEVLRNLEDAKTWDEFVSDEGFRFEGEENEASGKVVVEHDEL